MNVQISAFSSNNAYRVLSCVLFYSMASALIIIVLIVAFLGVILLNVVHRSTPVDTVANISNRDNLNVASLLSLITAQNETIHLLERHLSLKHQDLTQASEEYHKLIKTTELLAKLSTQEESNDQKCAKHVETKSHLPAYPMSTSEIDCENRYGMEMVRQWGTHKEVWCKSESPDDSAASSELVCYPYHQAHKKLDGRGPDMFCEAKNFVIDFSKVHGDHATDHKPALGSQYLNFDKGSLSSDCQTTASYRSGLFMPHHSLQVQQARHQCLFMHCDALR